MHTLLPIRTPTAYPVAGGGDHEDDKVQGKPQSMILYQSIEQVHKKLRGTEKVTRTANTITNVSWKEEKKRKE